MPYLSVSCFGTVCTPSTLPPWSENTSTICLRHETGASIKSSARCTMKGASPTTGRAQSTACPNPNGAGWRIYTHDAQLGKMPRSVSSNSCLPCGLQHGLELRIAVEMILDRPLRAAGNEHQRLRARGERLIHGILNQRFVDDRQHFLGACLGDGQKPRAAPGHRKYAVLYGFEWPWRNDSGFSAQFDNGVRLETVPGLAGRTMPVEAAPRKAALAAPIFLGVREQCANLPRDRARIARCPPAIPRSRSHPVRTRFRWLRAAAPRRSRSAAIAANTKRFNSPKSRDCACATSSARTASRRSLPTRFNKCGSSSCSNLGDSCNALRSRRTASCGLTFALRDLRAQQRGARKWRGLVARLAQEARARLGLAALDRESRDFAQIMSGDQRGGAALMRANCR